MLSGNRGEWSEIYAFFRLLADRYLYGSDASLAPNPKVCLRIIDVAKGLLRGQYNADDLTVCVAYGEQSRTENLTEMKKRAERLLSAIKSAVQATGSFDEPETEAFLASIGCRQIKSPSSSKRDMDVTVVDPFTGMTPTLGFSVKSLIGAPPTLLNASKETLFQYEIKGLSKTDINAFNRINGTLKRRLRAKMLLERATSITFSSVKSDTFLKNLLLLDDALPIIVASLLEAAWLHEKRTMREACEWVTERNPREYRDANMLYGVKIRRLLRAVALGMVPGTLWKDRDDATGGYVVVRPDGSLVAFYVYNRAMFDEYLFRSTKIETPSLTRYNAMKLYQEEGRTYIDFCLDIRFMA